MPGTCPSTGHSAHAPEDCPHRIYRYPENIQRVIRSDAEVWMGGDVNRSAAMYDRTLVWARKLTPERRTCEAAGRWHANDLLGLAAVRTAMREVGEVWPTQV